MNINANQQILMISEGEDYEQIREVAARAGVGSVYCRKIDEAKHPGERRRLRGVLPGPTARRGFSRGNRRGGYCSRDCAITFRRLGLFSCRVARRGVRSHCLPAQCKRNRAHSAVRNQQQHGTATWSERAGRISNGRIVVSVSIELIALRGPMPAFGESSSYSPDQNQTSSRVRHLAH
jgi:hypothetical protein